MELKELKWKLKGIRNSSDLSFSSGCENNSVLPVQKLVLKGLPKFREAWMYS